MARSVAVLFFVALASSAAAQVLDDPDTYEVMGEWNAIDLGIPGPLGALLFDPDEEVLYVVGGAEEAGSALYAVSVTRDPQTDEVVDLGPAEDVYLVFFGSAAGLDSGCDFGPKGTLFHTYWDSNLLAQRTGDVDGPERTFDMSLSGIQGAVESSVSGLTFSPYIVDPNTEFGMLQLSSYGPGLIYNVPLIPLEEDYFEPQEAVPFFSIPTEAGAGGIHYIPSGPHEGNLMYVDWDGGTISIAMIDEATGFPVDSRTELPTLGTQSPLVEPFAGGMGSGPWGMDFDPLTNDLFVSTYWGSPYDSIVRIGGFPPPEPPTPAETQFRRGDCNGDGQVNLSDAICGLNWLFGGAPTPGCPAAVNTNGDADANITDPVSLLGFLFGGGTAPVAPFPDCGPGTLPADKALTCANPKNC